MKNVFVGESKYELSGWIETKGQNKGRSWTAKDGSGKTNSCYVNVT